MKKFIFLLVVILGGVGFLYQWNGKPEVKEVTREVKMISQENKAVPATPAQDNTAATPDPNAVPTQGQN